MALKDYNFYHPFRKSSFGFFLENHTFPTNLKGFTIDSIDLYDQPLENPIVYATFFILKLLSCLICELLNFKVLRMVQKETSLLSDVTKLLVVTLMTLPLILTVFWDLPINLIYPVHELIGEWFCTLGWVLSNFTHMMLMFNSFITAFMRYLVVIHDKKVASYGKERVKRWFLFLAIALPMISTVLKLIEGSPDTSYIKKCFGKDHQNFLVKTSSLIGLKNKFWESDINDGIVSIDDLILIGKKICKIAETILFFILAANVTEGILYYKIFSHMTR